MNSYTCVNPGSCDCGRAEGEFCSHWGPAENQQTVEPHVHAWQPCGTAVEERDVSDGRRDYIAVITLAVRSCECGAVRKTEVARRYR